MKISIASGKGGTGKTFVSTGLALAAADENKPIIYVDCDVEEPNGHIFIKPEINNEEQVNIPVPVIDHEKCVHCGKCSQICQFNAILDIGKTVLTFPELCHSCGGCSLVCPADAITERPRPVGVIRKGKAGGISYIAGDLNRGDAAAAFLAKKVRETVPEDADCIIDCPPGANCPVVAAVKGSDFCILVTEPTPFGLHDLEISVEMLKTLNVPCAVVINRHGIGDNRVEMFCGKNDIEILARIPHDRKIASQVAAGERPVENIPELKKSMKKILESARGMLR